MDWNRFVEIPNELTLWHILDSQFLTTLLAAGFGILLLRYESRLRDKEAKLRTAEEQAQAAEEALQARNAVERKEEQEAPAPEVAAVPQGGADRREEARKLVESAKDYLEGRAAKDDDKRHQRTYEKISGHHPADLALALRDRGALSDEQFENAFALFRIWKKYGRGRAANNRVSEQDYNAMKGHYDRLAT